MRFLVDNPVSAVVAETLRTSGHDAIHVRDYGLQAAADPAVLQRASQENRIVITADTDFGLLLARLGTRKPSVILLHHSLSHRPTDQAKLLLDNLGDLESALDEGSLIVLERGRARIRSLPIVT
jgi:predicted nuclease of predicted toxin-antitoxin system